ncbi:MAG: hypothetical protein K5930_04140 [Treponemataceae bacterium]|nr:hypothetical protein [Treponemataceae bacterium]
MQVLCSGSPAACLSHLFPRIQPCFWDILRGWGARSRAGSRACGCRCLHETLLPVCPISSPEYSPASGTACGAVGKKSCEPEVVQAVVPVATGACMKPCCLSVPSLPQNTALLLGQLAGLWARSRAG